MDRKTTERYAIAKDLSTNEFASGVKGVRMVPTDFTKGRKAFPAEGRSVFRWRLQGHVTSWTYTRFARDSSRYRICLAWQTDSTCSGSFIRHSHFRFAPPWEFRSFLLAYDAAQFIPSESTGVREVRTVESLSRCSSSIKLIRPAGARNYAAD